MHDTVGEILFRAEEEFRFALLCGHSPKDLLEGELIFKDTIRGLATDLLEAAIHENESALTTFLGLLKHRHETIRGTVYRSGMDRILDMRSGALSGTCRKLLCALSQAEHRPENASFTPWWTATSLLSRGFW